MYVDSYNEVVKCLLARVPAINIVLEAERFLDQLLPTGLGSMGAMKLSSDDLTDKSANSTILPVAILDSNVLTGLSLRAECCKTLKAAQALQVFEDFVNMATEMRNGVSVNKIPDAIMVARLAELQDRMKNLPYPVFCLLVLRDTDLAQDRRLVRALARHCSAEVGVTVAIVTSDPIQPPNLRACIPVVRIEHPSLSEITKAIYKRLLSVEKALPKGGLKLLGDNGEVSVATASDLAELCGKSLVGLPIQQALNVLTMHVESGLTDNGKKGKTVTVSPSVMANAKADILNKEGYMTLIRDLPSITRIGGLEILKEWVAVRSRGFTPEAKNAKLVPPKGLMLVGPPGTAKSMSAKAIARIFGVPLIRLDMGSLFNSLVGSSERNLRNALAVADASAPCVLLVDEADKGLAGMIGGRSDSGVSSRLMGSLLTWMAEKETDVFVVFTANSIDGLPPEITRRGRLDGVFFVDLPNRHEREAIWRIHLGLVDQRVDDLGMKSLVEASSGFSGAEIEAVVQDAMYRSFDGSKAEVTVPLLLELLDPENTVPLSKARSADLKLLKDWADRNAVSASRVDKSDKGEREKRDIGF